MPIKTVTLVSSDNQTFDIDTTLAKKSDLYVFPSKKAFRPLRRFSLASQGPQAVCLNA